MAKFKYQGLDDLMDAFNGEPERAARLAPKMLEAGAAIVVEAQKREIQAQGLVDTGSLQKSIKATKVKNTAKDGYTTVVKPTGKDKKGVSNSYKGFIAEMGTSKLPARPWATAANEKCRDEVHDTMKKIWDENE